MEHDLMAIGQHCSVSSCQQLDFLPFKCDCCSKTFCLEHRTYSAHYCPNAGSKTLDVIVCPICAKGVHLKAGDDANAAFDRHARTDCDPSNYQRVMKKKKCPVPGCREKLTTINTYTCKVCTQRVCLKHRFESDHNCPGKSAHPLVQRQGAAAAAAAAAATAGRNFLSGICSSAAAAVGAGRQQQQQPQQQQVRPAAAAAARQRQQADPSNTVYGTADRRRQILGLPARSNNSSGSNISSSDNQQQQQGAEQCPQCSSRFASVQELIQHVESAHNSSNNTSSRPAVDYVDLTGSPQQQQGGSRTLEQFACPHCNGRFADAALLVAHSERCSRGAGQQQTCVLC